MALQKAKEQKRLQGSAVTALTCGHPLLPAMGSFSCIQALQCRPDSPTESLSSEERWLPVGLTFHKTVPLKIFRVYKKVDNNIFLFQRIQ